MIELDHIEIATVITLIDRYQYEEEDGFIESELNKNIKQLYNKINNVFWDGNQDEWNWRLYLPKLFPSNQ